MRSKRLLRDLLFCLLGAGAALIVAMAPPSARSWKQLPAPLPTNGPGELVAWTLLDNAGGYEFLGGAQSGGLHPCRLPEAGLLRPVVDRRTGLPGRVNHWVEGGPLLYVMRVEDESDIDPASAGGSLDDTTCPAGKVLVPAETIMSFLYKQAAREVGERR